MIGGIEVVQVVAGYVLDARRRPLALRLGWSGGCGDTGVALFNGPASSAGNASAC